jgi:tryptophan 2,3-dioxygenase
MKKKRTMARGGGAKGTTKGSANADLTYGDFLCLDELLNCQRRLGSNNNESLFIIQHQTSELWMKQTLLELRAARAAIQSDRLGPSFKMMARVSRILDQLVKSWDVLSTLTTSEYVAFRHKLGSSSGFQSYQYREIEFLFGHKNRAMLEPHRARPKIYRQLKAALEAPSLYDEALALLARRGFAIAGEVLRRDRATPHAAHPSVEAAWTEIYRNPEQHFDLYELGEELVDLEDGLRQWRFRHLTTVSRVIGAKPGTGGTAGVGYLRKALEMVAFPELWELRTRL